jgi:hypothetical protein
MELVRARNFGFDLDETTASSLFDWALCALLIFNGLDGAFTSVWVQAGQATEANPIMAALLANGVLPFLIGKISLVMLGGAMLRLAHKRPLAQVGMVAMLALYSAVMVIHVEHLRQVIG